MPKQRVTKPKRESALPERCQSVTQPTQHTRFRCAALASADHAEDGAVASWTREPGARPAVARARSRSCCVPKYARLAQMCARVYEPILTAGAANVPKEPCSLRVLTFCCCRHGMIVLRERFFVRTAPDHTGPTLRVMLLASAQRPWCKPQRGPGLAAGRAAWRLPRLTTDSAGANCKRHDAAPVLFGRGASAPGAVNGPLPA